MCCTLQGEDLFLESWANRGAAQALELIRAQVDSVDAFVAVSEYYAGFMSRYLGIPERKMHVVPLGINLKGYDTGFRFRTNCFTVGYFARVAPEKGLHVLCGGLSQAAPRNGFLRRHAGSGRLSGARASRLSARHRTQDEAVRTGRRVSLSRRARPRAQDRLSAQPDVLSVPGTYDEPKGIFVLEAMANGVPVVQPRRGAFPEIMQKPAAASWWSRTASTAWPRDFSLWRDPGAPTNSAASAHKESASTMRDSWPREREGTVK